MKIIDITKAIESLAPISYQESYDNAGLQVGNFDAETSGALLTVDVTEQVVDEAIAKNCDLIISHHPITREGVKKITGNTDTERIIIKAIQNNISIYAAHTNLDSVMGGVNSKIAEKLNLQNCAILSPKKDDLLKLAYFVPSDHAQKTREAIFSAGAGQIGDYDFCSFNTEGTGTFRGNEESSPFAGNKGEINFEQEVKVEVIVPKYLKKSVVTALMNSHPYEEVAHDIYPLDNVNEKVGMGMIGELHTEKDELNFLKEIKSIFSAGVVRHTKLLNKPIKKVALCGGSGSFLIQNAIHQGADIYITGDMKYHQFFEADSRILIADIGHFESEQVTKEIFYDLLNKKFPKFAVHLTEHSSNPINYL